MSAAFLQVYMRVENSVTLIKKIAYYHFEIMSPCCSQGCIIADRCIYIKKYLKI